MKRASDYLVTGRPLPSLFAFCLPMIIGNLFQQTYTMVDSAVVGRYVSETALAAVGASYSLTNIFVCVAIGGGMGASVLVSQYFGAGNRTKLRESVNTALLSFLVISILLAVFGWFSGTRIMMLLNTPEDVLPLAAEYLRIYFLGLPFLFLYNILSSMFNALGKSRIPLYFLIFSSLFNIFLDVLLVTVFHLGVAGVAWATLIAQGISAVLSFLVLSRLIRSICREPVKSFDRALFLSMQKIALPSVLQQSTVSIGMMLVQSVVNSFGSAALAGFSAAMRIESLCIVPMAAIGNAVSSYTAQNIGADRKDRVPQGLRAAVLLVFSFAALICVLTECFCRPMILLFLGDSGSPTAIATGTGYLSFMGWFFAMIGLKMSVDGLLRGAGDMKMFTIANLVNLSIRVIFAWTFAPRLGISMVWTAVPIGWTANFLISFLEYRTGKWRQIRTISQSSQT